MRAKFNPTTPSLLFTCCYLLLACKAPRYMYQTPVQNIPNFTEAKQAKVAAYYGSNPAFSQRALLLNEVSSYSRGVDVQSAYAFSDHLLAMANFCYRAEQNSTLKNGSASDSAILHYNRHSFEVGAGYYTALGRFQQHYFQVMAGGSFGKSSFTDDQSAAGQFSHRNNQIKCFLQPAFVFNADRSFSLALSSRFSWVWFNNIRTDYSKSQLQAYQLDSITGSPRFFWEPALNFTFQFTHSPLFIETQLGFTALASNRFVDHRGATAAIGVGWRFAGQRSKRKSP